MNNDTMKILDRFCYDNSLQFPGNAIDGSGTHEKIECEIFLDHLYYRLSIIGVLTRLKDCSRRGLVSSVSAY